MKKLFFLILTLLFVMPCMAQEGHNSFWVKADNDSIHWVLNRNSNQDTSKVFPLYSYMTAKFFFNDTSGVRNDSCQFKATLFTSSMSLSTFDSTFTLAQVVFNAPNEFDGDSAIVFWGGPSRPKPMFESAERFGAFIIEVLSTGSQVDSAIVGGVYLNGWSNQPGARVSKIGY